MKHYSPAEAADVLGMRVRQVRQAIRDGELDAEPDGRDYIISRDELEDFAEEQGIDLDVDDLDNEDLDDRMEAALDEHRPSWEAGFRSGFAAGAHEEEDEGDAE